MDSIPVSKYLCLGYLDKLISFWTSDLSKDAFTLNLHLTHDQSLVLDTGPSWIVSLYPCIQVLVPVIHLDIWKHGYKFGLLISLEMLSPSYQWEAPLDSIPVSKYASTFAKYPLGYLDKLIFCIGLLISPQMPGPGLLFPMSKNSAPVTDFDVGWYHLVDWCGEKWFFCP